MSEISCLKFDKSWANEHFQRHNFREISPDYLLKNPTLKNEYETVFDPKTEYQKIDFDSKRGRKVEYAHSIKEAVLLLKDGTRLSDIKETVSHIEQTLNIKCCSIAIHNDEGHIENGQNVYNTHAHLVFYTLDKDGHQNFRQTKIRPKLSPLQREIADKLGMIRPETGSKKKGLSAKQFRQVAKEKAGLTSEIKVKTAELQKLHQEQDLQVFKANLNHFKEGENSHDNYNFEHFSHDQYSHESFKDGINRELTGIVRVPRLSECSLASSGQQADLSLYVAQGEGVHRHHLGDGDPVLSLLSKTTFVTETGSITTLKQLTKLKSELRKAFIAEQGHTQEDYKQLNKAFEDIKKRFKTGAQMTPADVVKSVNAWLDLAVVKEAESERLEHEKTDLTSQIEVKNAEIEKLKTELQEKPKEVEVPREMTSEEIDNLPIVQALREQHEKDKQNVAQASRKADEYRKQLSEAKSGLTDEEIEQLPRVQDLKAQHQEDVEQIQKLKDANRQLVQSKKSSYTQRIEIIKTATEEELKEHSEVYKRLQTRLNNLIKTAKTGFVKILKVFGLSAGDEDYLQHSADVSYVANKAVEAVENTVNTKKLQEEHTQHRSFHR